MIIAIYMTKKRSACYSGTRVVIDVNVSFFNLIYLGVFMVASKKEPQVGVDLLLLSSSL